MSELAYSGEIRAGHASWVLSISCHPDGNAFATGSSDSKVKLWDLQSRACVQTLADHTDQVRRISMLTSKKSCLSSVLSLFAAAVEKRNGILP